jgi:hypothetical protein
MSVVSPPAGGRRFAAALGWVAAGSFVLYVSTLAPTVLWGDDAELQRRAVTGTGTEGNRPYELWTAIAHPFVAIPFGDVAWRVNLVSAVFGALTIGNVFATTQLLGLSRTAGLLASASLAVSHTHWLHSVRTEVYAVLLFFLSTTMALLGAWRLRRPHDSLAAAGTIVSAGFAMAAHLLGLLALPAIAAAVATDPVRRRRVPNGLLLILAVAVAVRVHGGTEAVRGAAEASASLSSVSVRDGALALGFLGYQFVGMSWLIPVGIVRAWRRRRALAWLLVGTCAVNVALVLPLKEPDRYVYYLPTYLLCAVLIGAGWEGRPRWLGARVGAALVATQVMAYAATPAVLEAAGASLIPQRDLPYRNNNWFFLWPPKNGYDGARRFGQETLGSVPPGAAVLADWLPLQTLRYLQVVEGRRPDVLVEEVPAGDGRQASWLRAQARTRPVFIADREPYYEMEWIERGFEVAPRGPIWALSPRTEALP